MSKVLKKFQKRQEVSLRCNVFNAVFSPYLPSKRKYVYPCRHRNLSKTFNIFVIWVKIKQRWWPLFNLDNNNANVCNLPQSYCTNHLSGKKTWCRTWGAKPRDMSILHCVKYLSWKRRTYVEFVTPPQQGILVVGARQSFQVSQVSKVIQEKMFQIMFLNQSRTTV